MNYVKASHILPSSYEANKARMGLVLTLFELSMVPLEGEEGAPEIGIVEAAKREEVYLIPRWWSVEIAATNLCPVLDCRDQGPDKDVTLQEGAGNKSWVALLHWGPTAQLVAAQRSPHGSQGTGFWLRWSAPSEHNCQRQPL